MFRSLKKMDTYRLLAAILVVSIHISPFTNFSLLFDFWFTRVLARVAVPLFLMITGYFTLSKALEDRNHLVRYTKKIFLIYLLCMFIYFPLNIYQESFKGLGILAILKMIFIDGTYYHLWYFPALIMGLWASYFLLKHLNKKLALSIICFLFLIGLLGDSYYGLTTQVPLLKSIYEKIFSLFNYTRNGLFYTPVFLSIGCQLKSKKENLTSNKNLIFAGFFLILMSIEGFILHHYDLQRHDSMYICLIPLMYFLFNFILSTTIGVNVKVRTLATMIYIMHPFFIVLVRLGAKIIHLENIFIEQRWIHYIMVLVCTIIFCIIFEKVKEVVSRELRKRRVA